MSDSTPGRTAPPPPEEPFRGRIEEAIEDSTAAFPEPLRAPAGAPNVLLIMGDDIGYGHMSAFGGPADTPVFDRLAERGLRFSNFHTSPVCAASRAALVRVHRRPSPGHGQGVGPGPPRTLLRRTQRNPRWLVELSEVCACRVAGRSRRQ
ncbi:sulfatase-like protein [Streptomyces sp. TLI_235]|nr:sulfatase-like hydrolase/transferase [Streptomyces sp. TLI_235]PBC67663.1 sulfatase-like protein [Streptomyces sp. TLI_235]